MTLVMTGLSLQSVFSIGEQTGLRMPFCMYISQEIKLPVYYFIQFTS